MPLFFETILPLGLDISDLKLRLVQLKKSGKNIKIASFSEVNIPSGIISDGLVLQPARLVELINQLKQGVVGSRLLKNKQVVVGLPEKQSISKLTPIANTDPETIIKEITKHVPFQLNEIYYDYQILNNFLNNCSALYFAASRKILIENYLKILRAADLEPKVFEIETEATARALLLPTDKSAYFIIDIGLARSTISIVYQRLTAFSISFPSIIYDKKAYISELINHLNRIIEFYQEHLSNYFKITAIITCGTGAHIKNLNEEIELKFGIKTLAGNPWQNIKNYNDRLIKKMKFPNAYSTAIGLALRPALNKKYF